MLQDCDRKMIRQEDKELRSSVHETVDWSRPTQIGMHAQDFIKCKRDWQRDRGCSTARHVDVPCDDFRRGRQYAHLFFEKIHYEMKLPFGSAKRSDSNGNGLADADFSQIANMLFQYKAPCIVLSEILLSQSDRRKELEHTPAEQMRVPHDIHVPHKVDPVSWNHLHRQNGQRVPISGCKFNHGRLSLDRKCRSKLSLHSVGRQPRYNRCQRCSSLLDLRILCLRRHTQSDSTANDQGVQPHRFKYMGGLTRSACTCGTSAASDSRHIRGELQCLSIYAGKSDTQCMRQSIGLGSHRKRARNRLQYFRL